MDEYNTSSEIAQQDRRIVNHTVDQERRRVNDMNARVAVLEIKVSTSEDKIENISNLQTRMIDKLDQHVIQSTARDNQLQQTISQITGAVTILSGTVSETNLTLKEIATMATTSATQLMKWDTIAMTLIKVVTVIALVVSGAWAVFTWVENARHEKIALADLPAHVIQDATSSDITKSKDTAQLP